MSRGKGLTETHFHAASIDEGAAFLETTAAQRQKTEQRWGQDGEGMPRGGGRGGHMDVHV